LKNGPNYISLVTSGTKIQMTYISKKVLFKPYAFRISSVKIGVQ